MEVQTLIGVLQELASDFEFDKTEQSGNYLTNDADITKVGVCVDPTEENIYSAAGKGVEVLVSYHPWQGEAEDILRNKKMTVMPLHTSWDNVNEGVNQTIAKAIGLQDMTQAEGIVMGYADVTFRDLLERCQRVLDLNVLPYYGELKYPIHKIGISCGPGFLPYNKKIWERCLEYECDTIISGELTLLSLRFASSHQLKLIDLGHSAIAKPAINHLVNLLKLRLKAFNCSVELFDDYYACSFYTKNYFLQQNDSDESLSLFMFAERGD